jgi:hypothetical protein
VPQPTGMKSTDRPVTAAKPARSKFADRPGLAAAKFPGKATPSKPADKAASAAPAPAEKKSVDKAAVAAAKPVTKPVRLAKADPLAPLSGMRSVKSKDSTAAR